MQKTANILDGKGGLFLNGCTSGFIYINDMIKVPKRCLICQSPWAGGHERPGKQMQSGLRVFYSCGASLSYKILAEGIYQLLVKNCQNDIQNDEKA